MSDHATLVVHRALTALHAGDIEQLTRQLDSEVIYDSGHELVSGAAAVAAAIAAPRFEHLAAKIIPGSVEHEGDRLIAHIDTVVRWRGSDEPADITRHTLAFDVRDGLIVRLQARAQRDQAAPNRHEPENLRVRSRCGRVTARLA